VVESNPTLPQEAEAAEGLNERSAARIEALRAEIEGQVTELGDALKALDAAMQDLSAALGGGKGPGTLLCLQDLQEFRTADQDLMAALLGFYTAQFSADFPDNSLAEVSDAARRSVGGIAAVGS
jgi:hypothetical protein